MRISVRANVPKKKKRATKAQQAKAKPMAISRFLATYADKRPSEDSSWRLQTNCLRGAGLQGVEAARAALGQ